MTTSLGPQNPKKHTVWPQKKKKSVTLFPIFFLKIEIFYLIPPPKLAAHLSELQKDAG